MPEESVPVQEWAAWRSGQVEKDDRDIPARAAFLGGWYAAQRRFENTEQFRLENVLLWIRTLAGMHYFGGAFDPEHMRTLANLAADALGGKELPDFEVRMAVARQRAQEMASALGFELVTDEKGEVDG